MYTHAFLTSLDYTENCYSCRYATWGRVSDVTLGDSWGSNQIDREQEKGISLVLCQTTKGVTLIQNSGIKLTMFINNPVGQLLLILEFCVMILIYVNDIKQLFFAVTKICRLKNKKEH